jgi:hypothetical protein
MTMAIQVCIHFFSEFDAQFEFEIRYPTKYLNQTFTKKGQTEFYRVQTLVKCLIKLDFSHMNVVRLKIQHF